MRKQEVERLIKDSEERFGWKLRELRREMEFQVFEEPDKFIPVSCKDALVELFKHLNLEYSYHKAGITLRGPKK